MIIVFVTHKANIKRKRMQVFFFFSSFYVTHFSALSINLIEVSKYTMLITSSQGKSVHFGQKKLLSVAAEIPMSFISPLIMLKVRKIQYLNCFISNQYFYDGMTLQFIVILHSFFVQIFLFANC